MALKQHIWRFKGKYWQYQLLGWSFFLFNELSGAWNNLDFTPLFFFRLITTYATLFGILEIARIFYRKIFRQIKDPAYYLVIAAVASFICSFFWRETRTIIDVLIYHTKDSWIGSTRDNNYLSGILSGAYVPFIWSILYFGIKYYQRMMVEKNRAKEALILAQKAHLQMLRYQLNPHFLFNSLNSIQALVHENPDQADNMVAELSEFLRYTLRYNDRIMISVREEIDLTHRYLNIEKIRYEERLNFEIVSVEDVLEMEIPCFITQPLVENSIKHGLLNNQAGIDLKLIISREKGLLRIKVSNSGSLSDNWKMGVGLKNILERLENSYPGRFRFTLGESGGYVIAEINISLDNEKDSLTDN